MAALPTVVSAVVDAITVLNQIEAWANVYFAAHPDKDKQKAVAQAIGKARSALNAANRTCRGTQELNQAQVDAAFADFKVAYQELSALCGGLPGGGFRVKKPGEPPLLTASADSIAVPEAGALVPKVGK